LSNVAIEDEEEVDELEEELDELDDDQGSYHGFDGKLRPTAYHGYYF
jgi:hypothetical protein